MTPYRAARIPIHPEAFSRLRPKRPRQRSGDHLKFIRSLPCAICGSRNNVQAAHIRMANRIYGKRESGVGTKSDDKFATPLCAEHHHEQHAGGEAGFWRGHAIDPFFLSTALYAHSGDEDAAADVIALARTRT